MAVILSIAGIGFAAFCIWLTVRIVNRRERWAKRTAAAIGLPMIYAASLGPFVWLATHGLLPDLIVDLPIYAPLQWLRDNAPDPVRDAINWYIRCWR